MDLIHASTALARPGELFGTDEEMALAGFLAGYSGLTRDAYAMDLRQFVQWSAERAVPLFCARRADIESFGRHVESIGRARATIARRLCTISCFYRYAEQEGLIALSPAVHVQRPRLDYESHATGPGPQRGRRDHALLSLLALNGLRVSEALGDVVVMRTVDCADGSQLVRLDYDGLSWMVVDDPDTLPEPDDPDWQSGEPPKAIWESCETQIEPPGF
jgi:hypothetical protein